MKILVVHNAYLQRGGEDAVVQAETELLRGAGHDVQLELVTNEDLRGLRSKIHAFAFSPYDPDRRSWSKSLVQTTGADVVHVHNFFPRLTPAVHQGAVEGGAAVVQTLHNYRLVCANALLLRNGTTCEKCIDGSPAWGVFHRCYRGSATASLAVARTQWRARRTSAWTRHVDRFIALSEFAKSKFVKWGLQSEAISVKPNFVRRGEPLPSTARNKAAYVGRLAREKGVHTLVEAWNRVPDLPLLVIGDGPERAALEAAAPPNVQFTGALPPDEVRGHVAGSLCLIAPSICYEPFGLVVAEAFELGIPVVASRIGGLSELVRPGFNGLHFEPGDAAGLAAAVERLHTDPVLREKLAAGAAEEYQARYTPETNLAQLLEIYRQAIETRKMWDA